MELTRTFSEYHLIILNCKGIIYARLQVEFASNIQIRSVWFVDLFPFDSKKDRFFFV